MCSLSLFRLSVTDDACIGDERREKLLLLPQLLQRLQYAYTFNTFLLSLFIQKKGKRCSFSSIANVTGNERIKCTHQIFKGYQVIRQGEEMHYNSAISLSSSSTSRVGEKHTYLKLYTDSLI